MGGGRFVAPAQRVTDFLSGSSLGSAPLPSSSYRLGVRAGPLHELYTPELTRALQARTSLSRGAWFCRIPAAAVQRFDLPALLSPATSRPCFRPL